MKITVIGCGRWGTFIGWYLDNIGHDVSIYGRKNSENFRSLSQSRKNDYLELSDTVKLIDDLSNLKDEDVIVISVGAQGFRSLLKELVNIGLKGKRYVLCMKGIEIETGKRLSEIADEYLDKDSKVAVWLGPGHVQEFYRNIPNCMVIDSDDDEYKRMLVEEFSSQRIRFYYGQDLLGNEIGGAAKNVIGIAAGALDGMGLSSLKGALMSRGTGEVARLINAMGGNPLSAYGLCHLGDYEATVFSEFSHNRRFGEALVKKEEFGKLAEGYYTVRAMKNLGERYEVDLPITRAVYDVCYKDADPKMTLESLFLRSLKDEFY